MAHKNRRSPPRGRWASGRGPQLLRPARRTLVRHGISVSRPSSMVSFVFVPPRLRGCPPCTSPDGGCSSFLPAASTHWRVHVTMAFFAGDPRWSSRSSTVIQRWYIMHRRDGSWFAWSDGRSTSRRPRRSRGEIDANEESNRGCYCLVACGATNVWLRAFASFRWQNIDERVKYRVGQKGIAFFSYRCIIFAWHMFISWNMTNFILNRKFIL